MRKRIISVIGAILLLLMSAHACAETSWKDVLKGLQATGTYTDDQIEARIDGDTATIQGKDGASITIVRDWNAIIDNDITPFTLKNVSSYVFENVSFRGDLMIISLRDNYDVWRTIDVTFGENVNVFVPMSISVFGGGDSQEHIAHFTNNGKIYSDIDIYSSEALAFDNNGKILDMGIDSVDIDSSCYTNYGALGEIRIHGRENGHGKIINEGYINHAFITCEGPASVELVNNGLIREAESLGIQQNENDDIGKISITGKGRISTPPYLVTADYHAKDGLDISAKEAQKALADEMLAGLYIEAGQYSRPDSSSTDLYVFLRHDTSKTSVDANVSIDYLLRPSQTGRLGIVEMEAKRRMNLDLTRMRTEYDKIMAKDEQVIDEPQSVDEKVESLGGLQKGDIVTFGEYEQDNDVSNGPEPIEWIVLDVGDETALLLSRYGLDTQILAYGSHEPDELFFSGLFNWLNEDFASAAFDAQKLDAIESEPKYRSTQWFTVLSRPQIETYFPEAKDRQTKATAHTAAQGVKLSENGNCAWWTCSYGEEANRQAYVRSDGTFGETDDFNKTIAVRPCFNLKLSHVDSLDDVQRPQAPAPEAEGEYPPVFEIGNVITFGRYEQDNKTSNGMEPIAWRVLAREGNKALLVSQKGLDTQPYHETEGVITWENCTLREWLNREFYETAFEGAEKDAVILSRIHSNAGNDTDDHVFVLSADEATTYLGGGEANRIGGTAYARKRGVYDDGNENAYWWTRTRDEHETGVLLFSVWAYEATLNHEWSWHYRYADYPANTKQVAVRPAIWVDMTADAFTSEGGATVVASGQTAGRVRIKANGTVNVRKESSKSSERVGRVRSGEEYEYVQVAENGWVQIRMENGELGYVSGKMVEYVN